jgi:DnaK suppressor protein
VTLEIRGPAFGLERVALSAEGAGRRVGVLRDRQCLHELACLLIGHLTGSYGSCHPLVHTTCRHGTVLFMDPDRARELLAGERERIENAIADLRREAPDEADDRVEPGDEDDEGLYQDEFDAGRAQDYEEQLAGLERAEARLAEGRYGLSVESGEPIPDKRLEAYPLAERTVDEEERGRSS